MTYDEQQRIAGLVLAEDIPAVTGMVRTLEAENAALWAFVKEVRTLNVVLSDTNKPTQTWKQWHMGKFAQAEELIYPYEAQS